jgi:hypothetical protein
MKATEAVEFTSPIMRYDPERGVTGMVNEVRGVFAEVRAIYH